MLNYICFSFDLFRIKFKRRGAAMTEYAVLLAFIAVVGVAFVASFSDWDENGNPTSLYNAIQFSIIKAWSAIDSAGTPSPPENMK